MTSCNASKSQKVVRLYSWNVNGFRAVVKKGFWEWFDATSPDILGIQETKISSDQLTLDMVSRQSYFNYWSHAEKRGYSGVALFTREKPLRVQEGLGIKAFDTEGRTLIAEYPEFVLYTIYYPNGQRGDDRLQYKLAFYDAFLDHADRYWEEGKRIVFCGDVNTAHRAIDLARPKENEQTSGFLPVERAWMDKMVDHGYVDTFRLMHGDVADRYSWWNMRSQARGRNVGWRIDYFFISQNLKDQVVAADIHDDVMGSDHCPVSLTLAF